MGRPAWQIRIITAFWPWRRFLAGMVGWPLLGRGLGYFFRGDRAHFIPVGKSLEVAESRALPGRRVEELIIASPFRFLLFRCPCRSLEHCGRYPAEIGCLFLGEGAREIDSAIGRAATVEEALSHHREALARGLIPMVGKLRWDSIWLGVQRADRLLTICHCCECCCYFKLYRHLPPEVAGSLRKLEGLEVRVEEGCDGCGVCVEGCFIGAMSLREGKAVVGGQCRGCGRCAVVCPKKAVRVFAPNSGPLDDFLPTVKAGARGGAEP